jgi:sialidase-1
VGVSLWRFTLFLLLACGLAPAAEPLFEQSNLFQAHQDDVAIFRIPGIVITPKGTVLAYCEARRNSAADWGEIEVHLRRSVDGGKTWEPARQIAHHGERMPGNPRKLNGGENEQTVNNPVAIVDRQSGAVHFLYCVNYARCFYMRSDDDGVTFSGPVEITAAFEKFRPEVDWKCLATGPGHGIQLENGRLLVPIWLAYGKVGEHSPSVTSVIYSDDYGQSWQRGSVALPNTPETRNPNETSAVQLADGSVMLNARSTSPASRRLVTTSPNGVTGWSAPRFDPALFEPICMGSIVRVCRASGNIGKNRLLFANPRKLKLDADGKEIPGGRGARENLSLSLSYDEGESWPVIKTLDPGPSAYSDLAVLPDGTMLCFYERKAALILAHFNLEWLTDGRDSME